MKKALTPLSILPVLILASCASPLPISKLTPVNPENSYWINGMEITRQTIDSVDVELGFIRREGPLYVFDVAITNRRTTPLLVNPSEFIYFSTSAKGDTLSHILAENPEHRILSEELRLAQLEADSKNNATSSLISATVELASNIAMAADADSENEEDYTYEANHLEEAYRINYETNQAIDQRSYWETSSLRKTTLFPEHYIQGQVFFKWTQNADQIWVLLPVENIEFEFMYRQHLYRAY